MINSLGRIKMETFKTKTVKLKDLKTNRVTITEKCDTPVDFFHAKSILNFIKSQDSDRYLVIEE